MHHAQPTVPDRVHTTHPLTVHDDASRAGQDAAMRGRQDGFTEDECARLYAIAYACTVETLTESVSA